ncbi:Snf7-like protein, partial [Helicosporidium sp. ATCC 50920]
MRVSSQTTSRTVDAIQKLSETEELLIKRQEVLDRKIALELERAREYLRAKNKRGATLALKKKKMYEQQHQQLESQLERVSEQQSMLENQRTVVETVDAMRVAAHASKQVMTEMRIGDVDKVLDLISEQADGMRQIQDALGTPVGPAADMDEDDLRNELEELEAEELDSQLL